MRKRIKYNGDVILALPCDSDALGCDKCMFNMHSGCRASDDMDNGVLPDCSDTPGNELSLGYRVYFVRDNTGGST